MFVYSAPVVYNLLTSALGTGLRYTKLTKAANGRAQRAQQRYTVGLPAAEAAAGQSSVAHGLSLR